MAGEEEGRPENRLDAEGNPTRNHDNRHGFGVLSLWRNAKTDELFICGDPSPNAARWFLVTPRAFAKVALSGSYADLEDRPKLGSSASRDVGEGKDSVAAGNDKRISGALQRDQNFADISDREKAAQALGLSPWFLTIAGSKDRASFLKELGFEYLLDEAVLNDRFQPKSERLSQLSRTEAGALDRLFGIATIVDLLDVMGILPGKHVEGWNENLDRLKAASEDGIAVATAANRAAIRGMLEVDPGKDVMPVHEAREAIRLMSNRITDLERQLSELRKAKQ